MEKQNLTSRIRLLAKEVSDKIAAGEVITGPLAVVKELVENAIDAGSTQIYVEILDGGKSLVRVTDNGCGIAAEDVELAFTPHATSKISGEDDLFRIRSLGFRGEALASIAAVSRLEMTTKPKDAESGLLIAVSAGEIVEKRLVGASDGTDIFVRNLFYNLPVREKFMASDRAETTRIVDFVSRTAVAWPGIRFRMTSNGNILFASTGKNERIKTIFTVFGPSVAEGLIEVTGQNEAMRLTSYISAMDKSRKSKRAQTIFVNGRYVKDTVLSDAIGEAYDGYLPTGRYPVVYLFFDIDPSLVDVNVHPTKLEIRFRSSKDVKAFIVEAIRAKLSSGDAMPQIAIPQTRKAQGLKREENAFYRLKGEPDGRQFGDSDERNRHEANSQYGYDSVADLKIALNDSAGDGEYAHRVNIKTLLTSGEADSANPPTKTAQGETRSSFVREEISLHIDKLQYIGAVFASYLLAESAGRFYIIDQHAAHERIHYERFLAEAQLKEHLSQELLTPYILQIPPSMRSDSEGWVLVFNNLGFDAEIFGNTSIRFRAFPAFLKFEEAEAFLSDILIDGGSELPIGDRALERLISRACRSSIKANEKLSVSEAVALLVQLSACENPYTCPHGRPVLVQLTKQDLERMFGRV